MKKKFYCLLGIILLLCFLLPGCQGLSDYAAGLLNAKCDELIDYFCEVALCPDFEGEVIARWERPIHIKVAGDYTQEDYSTLTGFVDRLNSIDGMPEISITDEYYNCYIEFSPQKTLEHFYYFPKGDWWMSYIDSVHGNIDSSRIGIATDLSTQEERNYMILLSITDTIGIRHSSDKYPDSIFYSKWNDAQSLSDMDLELICMLYSPSLHAGMNEKQTKEALTPLVKAKYIDTYLD